MPKLVKDVKGNVCDNHEGKIVIGGVIGGVDTEDYININGFIGYLQNFKSVYDIEENNINTVFGFKTENDVINLNISY